MLYVTLRLACAHTVLGACACPKREKGRDGVAKKRGREARCILMMKQGGHRPSSSTTTTNLRFSSTKKDASLSDAGLALCVEGGREGGERDQIMIDEGHTFEISKPGRGEERTKRALAFKMARGPWGKALDHLLPLYRRIQRALGVFGAWGRGRGGTCVLVGLLRT